MTSYLIYKELQMGKIMSIVSNVSDSLQARSDDIRPGRRDADYKEEEDEEYSYEDDDDDEDEDEFGQEDYADESEYYKMQHRDHGHVGEGQEGVDIELAESDCDGKESSEASDTNERGELLPSESRLIRPPINHYNNGLKQSVGKKLKKHREQMPKRRQEETMLLHRNLKASHVIEGRNSKKPIAQQEKKHNSSQR